MTTKMIRFLILTLILIYEGLGFNVDLPTRVMHTGPQAGSMFGFTVALYKYGSLNTLLVGAPKFQTPQPGVWNGGAVLNCSTENSNAQCSYVPFDIGGNSVHNLGFAVDNKTNQFFGATLKASKEKGIVVACAPNYVWFTETIKRRDPVGTCYVARDGLTDFQEFSPCRTSKWGYHRQGSCQAGFDAALTGDGERMFIGAPGAFYWQGQGWATRLEGQIHSQSLVVRNEYFTTGEGPATEDDQYMGYSVAGGEFNGDGIEDMALGVPKGLNYTGKDRYSFEGFNKYLCPSKTQGRTGEIDPGFLFQEDCQNSYEKTPLNGLAQLKLDSSAYGAYSLEVVKLHERYPAEELIVGIPRGQNTQGDLIGKIALFSHNLTWIQNVTGDQLGSYFGYCLAVVDFNGDKLHDIIVGAPMYTDFSDREMKIEVGKVHILIQNSKHRFSRHVEYIGTVTRGRFGLSVASLDDINLDGYGDFAVGAPYGGADGRGAVFIYHGFPTAEGDLITMDMKVPAQVIYASEIGSSLSTFGWSLSGGLDMDHNQYPDLLVGAYEAEQVFLFKSRPIIKFREHKLEFKSEGKTIDLSSNNCKIRRENHTCLDLVFCLSYTGVNVDDQMKLEVEYRLDTKQNTEQRMFFKSNDQNIFREEVSYRKEVRSCQTHRTYVKKDLVDKLTPITANVSYTLIEQPRVTRSVTPVLDRGQKLTLQDSLTIQKNCGADNVCVPDLVLTFDAPKEFLIGDPGMLNVSIKVENKGEDAFESSLFISEPKGLLFNKFEPKESTSCSTRKIDGQSFVKCDIGNPLTSRQVVAFNVLFQQTGPIEKPLFEFVVVANSTNAEKPETSGDNTINRVVDAKIEMDLVLFGSSDPDIIIYNTTQYQVPVRRNESHFGPSLIHKYGILNKGFAEIENVEIYILWPTRTLSGNHLLYLLEQPVTTGNIQCDKIQDVNPMNIKLMSKLEREKLLGISNLDNRHSQDDLSEVEVGKQQGAFSSSSSSSGGGSFSSSSRGGVTYTSTKKEKTYSSSSRSGGGGGVISSSTTSGGGGSISSSGSGGGSRTSSGSSRTSGSVSISSSGSSGGAGGSISSGGGSNTETYYSRSGSDRGTSSATRGGYDTERGGSLEGQTYSSRGYETSTGTDGAVGHTSYTSGERRYSSTGQSTGAGGVRVQVGGERGYTSQTGERGYTSQTGERGYTSQTGERGYSSQTGERGYSSQSGGESGYSSQSGGGERVYSSHVGDRGYSSQSGGESGYSSQSGGGERVYSSHVGDRGYSSQSGGESGYSSQSGGGERGYSPHTGHTGSGEKKYTIEHKRGYSTGENRDYSTSSNRIDEETGSSRVESGILHSTSGISGSEDDLARTLNVGGGGGLRTNLYSPSVGSQSGSQTSATGISGHSSQDGSGQHYHSSQDSGGQQYSSSQSGSSETTRHYSQSGGSSDSSRGGYYSSGDASGLDRSSSWSSEDVLLPVEGQEGSYFTSESRRVSAGAGGQQPITREGSYYSTSSHSEKSSPKTASRTYTYHSSSSSGGESSAHYENEIQTRKRRSLEDEFAKLVSECGATICTRIHCRTGRLARNDDVYIYIRSRLFVDTLKEFTFPVDDLTITTRMVTKANALSYGIDERFIKVDNKNVTTPVRSAKSLAEAPPIPWWVILLATLAGILILLLIILILWRCGYFKRHRPRHQARIMDDSQPLNPPTNGVTNGNGATNGINGKHRTRSFYPGDEAL